jgi:hypothetical protein
MNIFISKLLSPNVVKTSDQIITDYIIITAADSEIFLESPKTQIYFFATGLNTKAKLFKIFIVAVILVIIHPKFTDMQSLAKYMRNS